MTEIESSGRDVPTATSVRPMKASERPKDSAIPMAPFNSTWEPPTKSTKPNATAVMIQSVVFGKEMTSAPSALCSSDEGAIPERSVR